MRLYIRVVGIANSKKMLFNDKGINLDNWKELLQDGEEMNLPQFVATVQSKNFRNSVFADVTASDNVAGIYHDILQKSISVVACNKIAASSPYEYYQKLKNLSRERNVHFLI